MDKPTTKQRILNAALQLLENGGIKGLTQPAVAKLVGISQGQLTYHFQKRTDLVIAVTQSMLDQVADYLWSKNPELASRSFEKLLSMVIGLLKSETRVRALFGLVIEADENEEVRQQLLAQGDKVRKLIATALQLEESASEVTVAHAVMLGSAMMFFLQRDKGVSAQVEAHLKEGLEILIAHIQSKKAPPKKRPQPAKSRRKRS